MSFKQLKLNRTSERQQWALLGSRHSEMDMKGLADQTQEEDVQKGIRKLRELLKDPDKFDKWANETLDMSRLRKK